MVEEPLVTNRIRVLDPYAVMGGVKRWRDGSMKKRWLAAGMAEAERSFRRVKGCTEMPVLVAALRRHAGGATSSEYDEEAA